MADDDQEQVVVYRSDMLDLSEVDLATLSELPSAALRAAITRVRGELSKDGDSSGTYAGFRSSLRSRPMEAGFEINDGAPAGTLRCLDD